MTDRNDLAYWFPILESTGVPVPRTEIVTTTGDLAPILDGSPAPGFRPLCDDLRAALGRLGTGFPAFLRTGQGSGKHDWARTCYLAGGDSLVSHVAALVEWSETVDFFGLPTGTWAVREFLDLYSTFSAFSGMPVAREYRCFIRDGLVTCVHPYWPPDSLANPSVPDWWDRLVELYPPRSSHVGDAARIAQATARAFDGSWSLDLAQHRDGTWYAIDMAEAERSFHWPGCPVAGTFSNPR